MSGTGVPWTSAATGTSRSSENDIWLLYVVGKGNDKGSLRLLTLPLVIRIRMLESVGGFAEKHYSPRTRRRSVSRQRLTLWIV
jgi:hypothetical protein